MTLAAAACTESHAPTTDGSVPGELGDPCTIDPDCREAVCLAIGVCSRACAGGSDCPDSPWMCVSLPGRGSICDCTPAAGGETACNAADDDCDGTIDEGTLSCGDACVDGARDPMNCGGCGVVCGGGTTCMDGACACPSARPDVCGTACVDLATDLAHCGVCGNACTAPPPAMPACVEGACSLACDAGTDDCDGDATNGCETDTGTDPGHCGACGVACAFDHAAGTCAAGRCEVSLCDDGYGDCDADGANGCETDLDHDAGDCGACGLACDAAHATTACMTGVCIVESCEVGFRDCNAVASDGCEIDARTNASHCGDCGLVCPGVGRPNVIAACTAGACGTRCATGFDDCDGDTATGCEAALATDEAHCGSCTVACGSGETCVAGRCAARRFSGATGSAWETVPGTAAGGVHYPGYTDYSPAGSPFFFATTGGLSPRFARFDTASRAWTFPLERADSGNDAFFAGPAWVGDDLYVFSGTSLERYDVATPAWTTLRTDVSPTVWAQATSDGAGRVFAVSADGRVITYTIATGALTYTSIGRSASVGPRVAWDPLVGRLFIVPDIALADVVAFDPATGTVTSRASLPASRVTPTFCGDRSGHLYASGNNTGTDVWQYDVETDGWLLLPAALPFDHDANGACTVTDEGYLYVTDNGARLARLPLL